jgi:hypothetical protein
MDDLYQKSRKSHFGPQFFVIVTAGFRPSYVLAIMEIGSLIAFLDFPYFFMNFAPPEMLVCNIFCGAQGKNKNQNMGKCRINECGLHES